MDLARVRSQSACLASTVDVAQRRVAQAWVLPTRTEWTLLVPDNAAACAALSCAARRFKVEV
jgi:hypothetical protein